MPSAPPEIRYARSGNVDLAYQVFGEGPIDIVSSVGWVSHLDVLWELSEVVHFFERLEAMGRVVVFDKRGTGLSDRPAEVPSYEQLAEDTIAVMDAVGIERAVLIGWVDTAALALVVAASHPERVRSLVLGELMAVTRPDEMFPWGADPELLKAVARSIESGGWGQALLLPQIAPSAARDERIVAWSRRLERMSSTPSMAANLLRLNSGIDVRPLLPRIDVPTLVVHRRDAPFIPSAALAWLADQLPHGRYVEVPGDELPGYLGDVDSLMDEIEEFLLGTRTGSASTRRLACILFSDVVGSTHLASEIGDHRWHELLDAHRRDVRELLARYGGTEVDTAGDGFLATFDSPSTSIRCALVIVEACRVTGLEVRVGLHAGEVVRHGHEVTGMAVHIGARVAAAAGPGEVLASHTVRDLVIGSGYHFASRGRHELKGVPGEWELFAVS